jgi:serine/threonine protein kinase
MLSPGMVVADRYELDRELGHGGMGAVWLAHHTQLDTPCAIKFIHAESANQSEVRARFEREAKAAAQIRSSHVVQILDYGVWGDVPYIAMEYLQGEDLAARLKQRSRLTPSEASSIITQVGRALTKAHSAGLVHRDLKPENIFLVAEDDQEIAKVLDFGIAKSHEMLLSAGNNTKTGSLLGTPHYMSPEQAQGTKAVDHRSDLWSLAVVAYRCLTGRLPFESDALGDLLLKIIVQPLPIPSSIEGSVPPGFDAWWARATDRDPSGRFQSAREMTESLAVALGISQVAFPSSLDVSQARGGAMLPYVQSTTPMTHNRAMGAASPMQPYPTGHDPLRALSFGPIGTGEGPLPIAAQTPGPHSHSHSAQPMGIHPHAAPPAMPHGASTDSILVSRTLNDAAIPRRSGGLVIAGLIGAVMVGGLAAAGIFLTRSSDSTGDTPTATTEVGSPPTSLEKEDSPPPSVAPDPVPSLDSGSAGVTSPDPPTSPSDEPPALAAPPPIGQPTPPPPSKPPPSKPPPSKPPPSKPPPSKPPVPPPPPGNNWGF